MYNEWWYGGSSDEQLSHIRIISPTGNERVVWYDATCGGRISAVGPIVKQQPRGKEAYTLLTDCIHFSNESGDGRGGTPCIIQLTIEQMELIDMMSMLPRTNIDYIL
jgi:hypothetical protein